MMANPGIFQFMILSKIKGNHLIEIPNKKIASSKTEKLLRLTTDSKLNFDIHISNLYKVASTKLKDLGMIRNTLSMSQAKVLYNSSFLSQFNYFSLIWMFSNKKLQKKSIKYRNGKVHNEPCLNLQLFATYFKKN